VSVAAELDRHVDQALERTRAARLLAASLAGVMHEHHGQPGCRSDSQRPELVRDRAGVVLLLGLKTRQSGEGVHDQELVSALESMVRCLLDQARPASAEDTVRAGNAALEPEQAEPRRLLTQRRGRLLTQPQTRALRRRPTQKRLALLDCR